MKRTLMVLAVALALVAGACGASGDDGEQAEDEGTPTTEATTADSAAFGEMDEPVCGEGDLSVEPDEAGEGAPGGGATPEPVPALATGWPGTPSDRQ